jgi:hypothetical protein
MNLYQCTKNISHCTNFYNLTRCSAENNTCVEGHGYCVFKETIKPRCLCLPCFTGEHCEEELSKNLWLLSTPSDEVASKGTLIQIIMIIVFGAFLLFNGILCLQTYLCRKIRKTNLGIYLIMLSIVSIFIGLLHLIFTSISLHITELPHPYLFVDLHCLIYAKFVYVPLVAMYNWFIASVAVERVLVECFRNFGLHDSRRRSVVSSAVIVIICPLTTLPGIFTVRENQPPELRFVQCINFTPLGYILYATITRIHLFAFYFIYIVMNTVVLEHLLRHRRRFVDSDSLAVQVSIILHKHKDFFIPYLIQALGQLPSILMDFMMTCSTANTILVARLNLVFTALQIVPFAMTFYLYIYLSPVYWSEFWNSSPIGKCLMKVEEKLQTVYNGSIINNNNPSATHL